MSFALDKLCYSGLLLCLARRNGIPGEIGPTGKTSEMVKIPELQKMDKIGKFSVQRFLRSQP